MSDNGIIIGQIIKDSSAAEKSCTASINATQSKIDELNTKIKAIKENLFYAMYSPKYRVN